MTRSIRGLTMLALAAGLTLCIPAFGQNEKPATPAPAAHPAKVAGDDKANAAAEWEKANQLSPEHIEMARNMVGDWNTQTSFWVDPSQPAMVSSGKAKFEPIMGARFIRQSFETKMQMPDANGKMENKTFKGEGWYGFNTTTNEYESTWIDSSATGIMLTTGKKDAKGDIVFTGQYDDSATGKRKTSKAVMHHEGRDKMVYTMYDVSTDGTEAKVLEVVYTRGMPSGKPADKKDEKNTGN